MANDYWIVSVFRIACVFFDEYGYRMVSAFRIFIGKWMINDYWVET